MTKSTIQTLITLALGFMEELPFGKEKGGESGGASLRLAGFPRIVDSRSSPRMVAHYGAADVAS